MQEHLLVIQATLRRGGYDISVEQEGSYFCCSLRKIYPYTGGCLPITSFPIVRQGTCHGHQVGEDQVKLEYLKTATIALR